MREFKTILLEEEKCDNISEMTIVVENKLDNPNNSTDPTDVKTHEEKEEDYKIDFPLLSDFNKTAIKDYDVVNHDFNWGYKDVSKRATFVIDKNGIVRFIEILPTPGDYPNMDSIKEALRKIASQPVNQ